MNKYRIKAYLSNEKNPGHFTKWVFSLFAETPDKAKEVAEQRVIHTDPKGYIKTITKALALPVRGGIGELIVGYS